MVEFRKQLLNAGGGLRYMVQAHIALLMPYAFMLLGLLLRRKRNAEPGASPNVGPATSEASSEAGKGPSSVS